MKTTVQEKEVEILDTRICEVFTMKLRSDGILHSHTSSERQFTIDSLKNFNVVMGEMTNHKMVPLLITLDEFAIPPVETREFWAIKESAPYASADAYLTTSLGHKIIGNVYLKFNKPGRPTKIFHKMEDAIEWLRTFV